MIKVGNVVIGKGETELLYLSGIKTRDVGAAHGLLEGLRDEWDPPTDESIKESKEGRDVVLMLLQIQVESWAPPEIPYPAK